MSIVHVCSAQAWSNDHRKGVRTGARCIIKIAPRMCGIILAAFHPYLDPPMTTEVRAARGRPCCTWRSYPGWALTTKSPATGGAV
ncbi:MAG: hypothetical protein QOE20_1499 [Mycobacterium sp.]|jgi:hypothetical protein|nr:hypothetical protein [Mycobacterium sp.]